MNLNKACQLLFVDAAFMVHLDEIIWKAALLSDLRSLNPGTGIDRLD